MSERYAIHAVAQVTTVHPDLFYYDGPKTAGQYSDKTRPDGHRNRHYPEARLAGWKSPPQTAGEDICDNDVHNTEAKNYRHIHRHISLPTVLTNDRDLDMVLFSDALEQRLHTFLTSLFPLG